MYTAVGEYPNARSLLVLAPELRPIPGPEIRYTTYHSSAIHDTYHPILRGVFPNGEWIHCFLSAIWHNGHIEPHADAPLPVGGQRFHLAVQMNPDCWMLHDGTWQQLHENTIYTMDPTLPHASINWGHEPRVLFIVDVALGARNSTGDIVLSS